MSLSPTFVAQSPVPPAARLSDYWGTAFQTRKDASGLDSARLEQLRLIIGNEWRRSYYCHWGRLPAIPVADSDRQDAPFASQFSVANQVHFEIDGKAGVTGTWASGMLTLEAPKANFSVGSLYQLKLLVSEFNHSAFFILRPGVCNLTATIRFSPERWPLNFVLEKHAGPLDEYVDPERLIADFNACFSTDPGAIPYWGYYARYTGYLFHPSMSTSHRDVLNKIAGTAPVPALVGLDDLLIRAKYGSREAFCDFVKSTETDYLRSAQHRIHDWHHAEDSVQNAYIKVFNCCSRLDPCNKPSRFVARIMRNTLIDEWRKARASRRMAFMNPTQIAAQPDPNVDASRATELDEEKNRLTDAVNTLTDTERDAMILWLDGYKYKQIEKQLSLPNGTVSSRVWKAKKKLKVFYDAKHPRG